MDLSGNFKCSIGHLSSDVLGSQDGGKVNILVIAYFILSGKETYTELGQDYFEKRNQDKVERKLVERLERLGYKVTL